MRIIGNSAYISIIATILCMIFISCSASKPGVSVGQEYEEVPVPESLISEENPRPDVWAKYPGGKESLNWHIRMNTRIPEQARKEGYEGRIILSYEVDKEGRAGNLEPHMSPHHAITEMYSDIVAEMQRWQPAMRNGSAISQRYYIIASFKAGNLEDQADN